MSEPTTGNGSKGVKTLGVRLPDEQHAQFTMVSQLNGLSLNDAVLQAVQEYIDRNKSAEDFAERAAAALAEIEREANARRGAIEALFGAAAPDANAAAGTTGARKTKSAS
jgi:hypothetical protein